MNIAVIPQILSRHADDATFLWSLRMRAIRHANQGLAELAELDERIDAHLDGLHAAGNRGWEIVVAGLEQQQPGEVFVAAAIALLQGDPLKVRTVFASAAQSAETLYGFASALGWLEWEQIEPWVKALLAARDGIYRQVGIEACMLHGQDLAESITTALGVDDPALVATALRAVGEFKRQDLLHLVRERLSSPDDRTRFWACWSAALLGDDQALEPLRWFVREDAVFHDQALDILARRWEPSQTTRWIRQLNADPRNSRTVVKAIGILGEVSGIPWLIRRMQEEALARAAGEAFTLITGVDLAMAHLDRPRPEGFEDGPTDNPEDAEVGVNEDHDLPWPDANLISTWWEANKTKFESGRRYFMGQATNANHAINVLRSGYQRQRVAAAIELALLEVDAPLFELRAPAWRQQGWLQEL